MGGTGSGRKSKGTMAPMRELSPADLKRKIARLYFQGATEDEIADATSLPRDGVREYLQALRQYLKDRKEEPVEVKRQRLHLQCAMGLRKTWEIIESAKPTGMDSYIALRGLGVAKDFLKLDAEVTGVTSQKLPPAADQAAKSLMSELLAIQKEQKAVVAGKMTEPPEAKEDKTPALDTELSKILREKGVEAENAPSDTGANRADSQPHTEPEDAGRPDGGDDRLPAIGTSETNPL